MSFLPSPADVPLLQARGISKHFPGVQALSDVSLELHAGEVLAIIGENGAGKSTLMKILGGVYQPDAGTLLLAGKSLVLAGVADALRHGISLIHQELNLAENLSIADNLYLGRERTWGGPLGLLNRTAMNRGAKELLARVGLDLPPTALVGGLSPGQRQLVEIARALSLDARILIMDEPTSSLTQNEADRLVSVIDDLRRAKVAIVYISHRLGEVRRVADRVVALRDGRNAGGLSRAEIDHDAMVRLMVGRALNQFYKRRPTEKQPGRPPRLEVRDLRFEGGGTSISFAIEAGEIVGMAGLVGAGRTELSEALFGVRPILAGKVLIDGNAVRIRKPRDSVAAGMVLVPEDRRRHGLVLEQSVRANLSLPNLSRLSWLGLVSLGRELRMASGIRDRLSIRAASVEQLAGQLSGGNQQKIVLGKWLERMPSVLLLDEPTRGVDVGAKSEIYSLMDGLARAGAAILMISSDLEEVLGMSDRVLVLHESRLAGELGRHELTEEAVMRLATGRKVAS